MSRFRLVVLTFALILPCVPCPQDVALAQWSADPMVNTPVCVTAARQGGFGMVDDGNGGAIIVWQDLDLNTSENDLYAQRINSDGIIQWGAGGVTICDVPGHQTVPSVARDGAGGAFVVWQDNRSGQPDIYAQRIDSNGVVQWLGNGVPVARIR